MRLLREVQILKELLEREKEVRTKSFYDLRILHFSPEISKIYEEYKRKGYCWRRKATLDKFLDTDKYLEKFFPNVKYLLNSQIWLHRVRGVDVKSPEMGYYRDMCWFYNSYLDSWAEIKAMISNKSCKQISKVAMSNEYYKKCNINWRFSGTVIVSAVTFVESVVNALHFEFLNAPQYEKKRKELWPELNDPETGKKRKKQLAWLFGVDPADPEDSNRKSFAPLKWKLKNVPSLLSGEDENKPDLNEDPYETFSEIRAYYRNSLVHPSYESEPIWKVPESIKELVGPLKIPSKMEAIHGLTLYGPKISQLMVNAAIDIVEDLYKLGFGTKHNCLWWWLAKPGDDGRFRDPDQRRKLSEIRNRTKN